MRPATRHLGLGFQATLRHLPLVALQTAVDLLDALVSMLPGVVAAILVIGHLGRVLAAFPATAHPVALLVADLVRYVVSPAFLLPVLGLALAGALLAAMVRVLYLTGALGLLGGDLRLGERPPRTTFMDAVLARFPAAVAVAALLVVAAVVVGAFTALLVGMAALVFGAAPGAASALGLAFVLTLAVVLTVAFEGVRHLALVRTVVAGDGPLVAIYEATALLLRRPVTLLALGILLLLVEIGVALLVGLGTGLSGLLPAAAAASWLAVAARMVGEVVLTAALAVVAVMAQGALVSLVLESTGGLPPEPEPEPVRAPKVALARPVAEARPVVEARPVTDQASAPSEAPPGDEDAGASDPGAGNDPA